MDQTPRKRDKEASKRALLRAGLKVFSTYGYDAATTKKVAAEAGLNEQLISRYFGGKAGLLLAVLTDFLDEEANDSNYPPAIANGVEEELRHFLLYRHARLLAMQGFFRTFVPLSFLDASIKERLEPVLLLAAGVLFDRLTALQKRHLIRADADLESASLMANGVSFFVSFMLRVSTTIDETHLTRMISEFAADMAHGLAPPPS